MATPDEQISFFKTLVLVHHVQLAATVVVIYDHICTLDREVRYIWRRQWTLSKALFLGLRYLSDILLIHESFVFIYDAPSQRVLVRYYLPNTYHNSLFTTTLIFSCLLGIAITPYISGIVVYICQAILSLRVIALYQNDCRAKIFLLLLFLVEVGFMLYITIRSQIVFQIVAQPLFGIRTCTITSAPSNMWVYWMSIVGFESVLFLMALAIAIRDFWLLRLAKNARSGATLTQIILRDSVVYFLIALAAYATTAITWLRFPLVHPELTICLSQAVTAILGSRLVLNLTEAHYSGFVVNGSIWTTTPHQHASTSLRWNARPSVANSHCGSDHDFEVP